MKKLILIATMMLAGCGYASVDAGEEGVLVYRPWFFGHGGIDSTPITTGSTVVASSTEVHNIPITPLAFNINFDDIMPNNGIPLDFQTTVRLQITDSVAIVRDWNGAHKNAEGVLDHLWFHANVSQEYGKIVRAAVRRHDLNSLAMTGTAVEAVDQEVNRNLAAYLRRIRLPVRLLGVTVGRAHPPQAILNQRTETAAQEQRQQTEAAGEAAEITRRRREQARAEADNAYRMQMGMSPEQFVELERIKMQQQACARGTCIFGNATPIVGR